MRILFDNGVPKALRRYLAPHEVVISRERGWAELKNGALLSQAEVEFDVLLSTDSNITSQHVIANYQIALIVLRAYRNRIDKYLPLLPKLLATLDTIQPGTAVFLHEDESLRRSDERKGKR